MFFSPRHLARAFCIAAIGIALIAMGARASAQTTWPWIDSSGRSFFTTTPTPGAAIAGSVVCVRKTGPASVGLNEPLTYQIQAFNSGDSPIHNVTVADEVPPAMAALSASPMPEVHGRTLFWRLGTLQPRESRCLQVQLRAEAMGIVSSCVEMNAAPNLKAHDRVTTNVVASTTPAVPNLPPPPNTPTAATTPKPAAPDISVAVKGPDRAKIDEKVTHEFTLTNRGAAAVSLYVRDQFEPGLEDFDTKKAGLDGFINGLKAGESITINVTTRAVKPGRAAHTFEVMTSDKSLVVAKAQPAVAIEEQVPASVRIDLTGPKSVDVGTEAKFTAKIRNTGPRRLTDVRVTLRPESNLTAVSVSDRASRDGEAYVWTIAVIEPNASSILELVGKVDKQAKRTGCRVTAVSAEGAKDEVETTADVRQAPKPVVNPVRLQATASCIWNPAAVGRDVPYEIRVENKGKAAAKNVAVSATAPIGLFPSAFGTRGPTQPAILGQSIRFEPIAEMKPGDTATFFITVRAERAGEFEFQAEIRAEGLDSPVKATAKTKVF